MCFLVLAFSPCAFSLCFAQSHTKFMLIFTLVSTGPGAINCVPGWEQRKSVAGSVGCTQQRGRQGWAQLSSQEGSYFLIRLPTWIPRIFVPEDVLHQKKIGCLLPIHLRLRVISFIKQQLGVKWFLLYHLGFESQNLLQSAPFYSLQSTNVQTNKSFMALCS